MPQNVLLNRKATWWASACIAALSVSPLSFVASQARAASADAGPSPALSKKAALPPPVRSPRAGKRIDAQQEIARYSVLLAKNPNNAAALLGRGKAYVTRREYTLAFADYDRAAQLAPQSKAARYGRAAVIQLLQEQATRLTAKKPTRNNADLALDGSQFDDDGVIRSHTEPPAPAIARN